MRVDHFGGHVAGCGIAKVGAGHGGIFRVGISVVSIFAQRRGELDRRGHFEGDAARARVQNIVAAKRDVFPPLLAPFVRDEVRELIVAVGSGGVRFGSEGAVPFSSFFGRRNRLKRGFELVFGRGVRWGKTENRRNRRFVLLLLSGKRESKNEERAEEGVKIARTKKHNYLVLHKKRPGRRQRKRTARQRIKMETLLPKQTGAL